MTGLISRQYDRNPFHVNCIAKYLKMCWKRGFFQATTAGAGFAGNAVELFDIGCGGQKDMKHR